MAIILDSKGKKKDTTLQTSDPGQAPIGAPAPTSAPVPATQARAAAPRTQGSGQFTDLSRYLAGNKEGLGNIARDIASKAQQGVDTKVGVQLPQAQQTTVDLGNAENVAAAKQALGASFDRTALENQLDAQAAEKQRVAQAAENRTKAIASGDFGQIRANSNLAGSRQGIANLSAFGLLRDPNSAQTFKQAADAARDRNVELGQNIDTARGQIEQAGTQFAQNKTALQQNIAQQQQQLQAALNQQLATENAARQQAAEARALEAVQGVDLTRAAQLAAEQSGLPIQNRLSMAGAAEVARGMYNPTTANLADVVNPEQAARLQALQSLGGGFDIGQKTTNDMAATGKDPLQAVVEYLANLAKGTQQGTVTSTPGVGDGIAMGRGIAGDYMSNVPAVQPTVMAPPPPPVPVAQPVSTSTTRAPQRTRLRSK